MGKYKESLIIGCDFDGTVVTHSWPNIGKDIGAVPVLKKIVANGHRIMIWTLRGNPPIQGRDTLAEAVKWYADNDIPVWGVNENPAQKASGWTNSNKQEADIFIDDVALGCPLKYDATMSRNPFVDWVKVEEMLIERKII